MQSDRPPKKAKKNPTVFNNFQQGDILFGLLKERDVVERDIKNQGFHYTNANSLNNPLVNHIVADTLTSELIAQLSEKQLEHINLLCRHYNHLIKQPCKPIPVLKEDVVLGGAYRRACKLLLINREEDRTSNAHVITNGISWQRVCDKSLSAGGITDSEMRAAYRDYKKNGRNPHVFFYDKDYVQMNCLPWELPENQPYWDAYEKARQSKIATAAEVEVRTEEEVKTDEEVKVEVTTPKPGQSC